MRGVATLDDFAHAGACALSNVGARRAMGAGQVCAPQRYYIDDVMVMNIIKTVKIRGALCAPNIWPDQLKNASAVPVPYGTNHNVSDCKM